MTTSALIEHIAGITTASQTGPRRWTRQEEKFLQENLHRLTFEEIGQRLGRTANALKIRQVRREIPVKSKRPGYFTGHMVSKILCVDIHSVMEWQRRGIMKLDVLPGERRIMSISRLSLWVWAINPKNWIYFKPERVRDPRLRRLIELRRQKWGDAWWTTGQVAEYAGLASSNSVEAAIMRGKLRGVKWGNWRVLKSDALAYPWRIGKGSNVKYTWSDSADDFLLRARDEMGLSYMAIGRMMKISGEIVRLRYLRLKNGQ